MPSIGHRTIIIQIYKQHTFPNLLFVHNWCIYIYTHTLVHASLFYVAQYFRNVQPVKLKLSAINLKSKRFQLIIYIYVPLYNTLYVVSYLWAVLESKTNKNSPSIIIYEILRVNREGRPIESVGSWVLPSPSVLGGEK